MKTLKYILLFFFSVTSIGYAGPPDDEQPREFTVEGLKVIFKPSIKEIISVRLFIKGGTANYTKELEGIEGLSLALATQGGTKTQTKTEFASSLEKIGTTIGSSSNLDYGDISMSCVKSFWEPSWKLFADAITSPRFEEKEYAIIKGQAISAAREAESDPDEHLRDKSLQNTFPNGNYAKSTSGTALGLEKISLQQVIAHYNSIIGKQNCFLVVVGNISEADLKQKVSSAFSKLAG